MKTLKMLFAASLLFILAACGNTDETEETPKTTETVETTLKVASLIPPMTEILDVAKPLMKDAGYDLEVVILSDNVQPNSALQAGEVDANFFQHKFFMEEYNKSNGTDFVAVQQIYYPNYGVYSKNYNSFEELPDGASVAIANDLSNIDRTLQLLAQNDIITLSEKTDTYYTLANVKDNPQNLQFKEVDLLMLARMYDEADAVVMYPSYAKPLNLTPTEDAILVEGEGNEFALQLVTTAANENDPRIEALKKAMTSEEVRTFLEENYKDAATPAF